MKQLINLTPHAVNIYHNDSVIQSIQPSGLLIRASETEVLVSDIMINGTSVPIYKKQFGNVCLIDKQNNSYDLYEKLDLSGDTLYIVSKIAYDAVPAEIKHLFLLVTDTVRDEKGNIIGCRGFAVI